MSLTAAFVTFGIIFVAELPDKTMVASLVMGSRYRPLYVWAGVAAAFLVHVTLAVAAGSVLTLLPHRVVDAISLVLFAVGAVLVYREGRAETDETDEIGQTSGAGSIQESRAVDVRPSAGEPAPTEAAVASEERESPASRGFWRVAATSFTVIFLAEMGDLTQISTANLAARFGSPVTVWLGALLALWSVAAIAIAGGRGLLRVVPVKVITRIAAAAFVILAILSLIDVIRG
ncbi:MULTISPECIES: TMEM165/GDT1 family protein [Pseudofrankia]|uniref:TMEM165/GDT1 family protein n=1 Tax=Pseudofrankia TaxID=2994363 RepID=UPI000234B749|nr:MULTISPECIES: TMEM165/GDT1 family protein [Pseudofrankia]OHV41641.1 hypothetical protein BCD49_01535 [Pseudofrankia sp. EUN1h]